MRPGYNGEMRDYQYHYANCEVGPAEVMPAFLSDDRQGLQLHAASEPGAKQP
jgi:hypothetical protein